MLIHTNLHISQQKLFSQDYSLLGYVATVIIVTKGLTVTNFHPEERSSMSLWKTCSHILAYTMS